MQFGLPGEPFPPCREETVAAGETRPAFSPDGSEGVVGFAVRGGRLAFGQSIGVEPCGTWPTGSRVRLGFERDG